MIGVHLMDNTIRINCSSNQIIDTLKLKEMYRSGIKLVEPSDNLPIIVDVDSNVKFSDKALLLFNRLDRMCTEITLVIISG